MTEERITETRTETPSGDTHTQTTVVHERDETSGGGGKLLTIVVLLVLAALAIFAFMQMSDAEVARDNAIADAAEEVGDAAGQVGDAAQDAADNLAE